MFLGVKKEKKVTSVHAKDFETPNSHVTHAHDIDIYYTITQRGFQVTR